MMTILRVATLLIGLMGLAACGTMTGAGVGAVGGAAVGGPIGAGVGGVAGAAVGSEVDD